MSWGYEPRADPQLGDESTNPANLWPAEKTIPGFERNTLRWMRAMLQLSRNLLRAFALGLSLDETHFDTMVTRPEAILRMNHYPSHSVDLQVASAMAANTDDQLFTILAQDQVQSLQVASADGHWMHASPIPGTFVVNIGDAMSMWTNGIFISTLHRVVNLSGQKRYSIPFFFAGISSSTMTSNYLKWATDGER